MPLLLKIRQLAPPLIVIGVSDSLFGVQEMRKTQQTMVDVECQIEEAGEVLGERKISEQEATEALRKAKAAREAFLQGLTLCHAARVCIY